MSAAAAPLLLLPLVLLLLCCCYHCCCYHCCCYNCCCSSLLMLLLLKAAPAYCSFLLPTYTTSSDLSSAMSSRIHMTYLFRSVLFSALTVTAVMYGLAVYYGLSNAQHTYAGKEFKYLAEHAGRDIRNVFTQSAKALSYLAERYATEFPHDEDWPTVLLPGFVKDLPYLRDTT
ncbi:hypothetical protein B484DRAFT_398980, partial [Ochromonadaceae sp. CCMP2298]